MNVFYAVFLLILLFSQSFGANERCGTVRYIEDLKNPQKRTLAKKYNAESPSGVVKEKRTQRFIIYYVTEGIHAVKELAYIDSLAKYLEQAYDLHKNTLGMKYISGTSRTAFYEKSVPSGLYPVEVIDTGDWGYCGTYGLTIPFTSRRTQISIENDFIYGVDCPGAKKGTPFMSNINGNYSKNWHLALKVTVFHELYHSFQLAQFNLSEYYTFWLEASATGVEEIGAPEVNDYIDYLPSVFNNPGKSMDSLSTKGGEMYGYATLYLFLYSELGQKFDSYIWDYFSKYPKETFAVQLARYINSHGKEGEDVEGLFHKYATHIFYSGSRAASSPNELFWEDMPKWPNWRIKTVIPSYLSAGTFTFIKTPNDVIPNTDFAKKISALEFGKNNDSTVFVLSRLLEKAFVPPTPLKEFVAYPNPWNPKRFKEIKFKALPENSSGVEIRSANGILIEKLNGEAGNILTWQPEKPPAPGILYYRILPYGKNKVLLVEY
jgi:hypothetical protein